MLAKDEIVVSICCITFNHADYIARAIESFLMQKTDFRYEIIINDDASTDGTTDLVREYQSRYPEIIVPVYHEKNEYAQGLRAMNVRNTIPKARGRYIALCEGDDFWTDPLKLQKQVDFLESNPEFVASHHAFILQNEKGETIKNHYKPNHFDFTPQQMVAGALMKTNTIMFRNVIQEHPKEAFKITNGDTYLIARLAEYGHGKYQADILPSVYMIHPGGVWSKSGGKKMYSKIETFEVINRYAPPHLKKEAEKSLVTFLLSGFIYELKSGSYRVAARSLMKIMSRFPGLLIHRILARLRR